jgi:hypothetical protein
MNGYLNSNSGVAVAIVTGVIIVALARQIVNGKGSSQFASTAGSVTNNTVNKLFS